MPRPAIPWPLPTLAGRFHASTVLATARCVARPPRISPPGLTQHIVQRGNNRAAIFHRTFDYRIFLSLLRLAAAHCSVEVHAYALMANHFHVMATPGDTTGLSRMMQAVGRGYVPLFNARYSRTGGLWEGRYRSSIIYDETYWLTCMRYVELNPVRAGVVSTPGAYHWSSFRAHASSTRDPIVSAHPLYCGLGATPTDRQRAWRAICAEALPAEHVGEIRTALKRGQALGERGRNGTSGTRA